MNLDFVETLRNMVAAEAADRKMRNMPQLQIPYVKFAVPAYAGYGTVADNMGRRLATFPNVTVKTAKKGTQYRVRMEYRT